MLEADPQRFSAQRERMDQPPYGMDKSRRNAVLASMMERCSNRGWTLLAAHVRTNHVHLVVEADARPERVESDERSEIVCQPLLESARTGRINA
jgi:hypothetical protein